MSKNPRPKTKRRAKKPKPTKTKKREARRVRITDEDLQRHRLSKELEQIQAAIDNGEILGMINILICKNQANDGVRFSPGPNEMPRARVQYLIDLADRVNMDSAINAVRKND